MATESPAKRVLAVDERSEWVLDSASDLTSRFFGMDRGMLRTLFCYLYLVQSGPCRQCKQYTSLIAYYLEEDSEHRDFLAATTTYDHKDREPVFMCDKCSQVTTTATCQHCGEYKQETELFDPDVPLGERPPCSVFEVSSRYPFTGKSIYWHVSKMCTAEALAAPSCNWCGLSEWMLPHRGELLYQCSLTLEWWCNVCMANNKKARCRGRCDRIVYEDQDHGYCQPCNRHRDKSMDTPSSSLGISELSDESSDTKENTEPTD